MINEIVIPIKWVDLDAYNHVGNQHYFEYMVEARATLLMAVRAKNIECLFVVLETRCQFKQAYFYPGNILLRQFLLNIGNSSFELQYLFSTPEAPEVVRAEGYAKMVCVDPVSHRPIKIPDSVRTLLPPKP